MTYSVITRSATRGLCSRRCRDHHGRCVVNVYTVSRFLRDALVQPEWPVEDLAWQDAALCAEVDPEIFFVEKGGSTAPAKRVCRSCEVREFCLQYALDHEDVGRYGIWGGMSERERRHLRRQAA